MPTDPARRLARGVAAPPARHPVARQALTEIAATGIVAPATWDALSRLVPKLPVADVQAVLRALDAPAGPPPS